MKGSAHVSPLLILISVLAVLTGMVGWYFYSQNNSEENVRYSGPVEKVRIGNVGEYTIFNLIAKEKGHFASNGLDADVKEYTSGPASLAALFAGETDINIAADFVGVRNIFDHPELRILAQVNQHRVFSLAAKESKISSPSQLKGKKIGLTKNSAGEYFLGHFLNDYNLQLEDITMVDLTPPQMISGVQDDSIDAMVVFEPNVYKLKKLLGDNFVSWDIQGDQKISALVYTTEKYLTENPSIVERYLQSLVDAETYYTSNQEDVKKFVGQKLKYDMDYVEYSWPKFNHTITLNQELILNMENEAKWVIKSGLTTKKNTPNYLNFIYTNALEKVKPDAITLIH